MKTVLLILTIFLISACLKIEEIEISNSNIEIGLADELQSILPANIVVIVTKIPTWEITLKDSNGNPVRGVTPEVDYIQTSYPRIFTSNTFFTCSASNASGISRCQSNKSSYVPSSIDLTVNVGAWSKNITLSVACPGDWSEIDEALRITSPTSLVDTAEELDLLRCNQPGETYYIQEINFANSPEYIYYPIALNHNVSIEFTGALRKLSINDDPAVYPEPPSLFHNSNPIDPINGLSLKGFTLLDFSYTSNRGKTNYSIIAPRLDSSSIEGLSVRHSSITLGTEAVGTSISLFYGIDSSEISGTDLESVKFISRNVDQLSFIATNIKDVTIDNGTFKNLLMVGNMKESSGIIASTIKTGSAVNTIDKIAVYDSYILNSNQSEAPFIGGLIGDIESDLKTNIKEFNDYYIDGLHILGSRATTGGLVGRSFASVTFQKSIIKNLTIASYNFGGLFGKLESTNQVSLINENKISIDLSDYASPWLLAEGKWNFNVSDYGHSLDQIQIENTLNYSGGLFADLNLDNSELRIASTQLYFRSPAGGTTSGIAANFVFKSNTFFGVENFELVARLKTAISNSFFSKLGTDPQAIIKIRDSILRFPEFGSIFIGVMDTFSNQDPYIDLSNLYVHYHNQQVDCGGTDFPELPFISCVNNINSDVFDVNYVREEAHFFLPDYNNEFNLSLDVWNPADDSAGTPFQLK